MTAADIEHLIEKALAGLPERTSGNEANQIVAESLRGLRATDRGAVVGCMRNLLSFRPRNRNRHDVEVVQEARVWLALDVTELLALQELCPDIEHLCRDIRAGLIFKPVHETMVNRYLQRMATR